MRAIVDLPDPERAQLDALGSQRGLSHAEGVRQALRFWLGQQQHGHSTMSGLWRNRSEDGVQLQQEGERPAPAEPDLRGQVTEARKRVELLAMNAVFEAEKVLGRMPKDVSAQRGLGYDIESIDADGNLFFIEVKGRADGADSITLTINEVNTGRNAPHRFRLALVSVEGDRASAPVYVSGVNWGLPGFGDTQITKNLQQLLAAGRAPH